MYLGVITEHNEALSCWWYCSILAWYGIDNAGLNDHGNVQNRLLYMESHLSPVKCFCSSEMITLDFISCILISVFDFRKQKEKKRF